MRDEEGPKDGFEGLPISKWKCPSCQRWVREAMGRTCKDCRKPELFPNLVREGS